MTEDELFARRPLGMRMAMVVRQWRAIIDSAITDTGLTQSSWTVLMQLHQLGDNVSVSELAEVQGIELPPLMRTLSLLEKQGYLVRSTSPYDKRIRLLTLTAEGAGYSGKTELRDRDLSGARNPDHPGGRSRHLQRHVKSNRLPFAEYPRRR